MDLNRFLDKKEGSSEAVVEKRVGEKIITNGETNTALADKPVHYLDIPLEKLTPGMRQFVQIKKNHLDCVILFRMGDFYETFYDDAVLVAEELEIVLTARGQGEKRAPLAGIPYHALEPYLTKLVKKGHKVAIVEQLEDPKKAKGIVKRGVVRIVTPGTMMEQTMLEDASNNYVMSLVTHGDETAFALCDISTGEFVVAFAVFEALADHLTRFQPAECIIPMSLAVNKELITLMKKHHIFVNPYDDRYFREEHALQTLTDHFKTMSMDGFGIHGRMVHAAGALLSYVQETQKTNLNYINKVHALQLGRVMALDASTIRNLELLKNMRDNCSHDTLLSVLDKTKTALGGRLVRKWIKEPLLDVSSIKQRLDAVEWLKKNTIVRNDVVKELEHIQDVERLISRVNYGNANARDLLALKKSLEKIPRLKELLAGCDGMLSEIKDMDDCAGSVSLIDRSIREEPAITLREGNIIKRGFHEELDKLHDVKKNSKIVLKNLEERERQKTGIKTMRVKFNNVFGYFLEVSKGQIPNVPEHYVRRQTLANAERYITPELKEQEDLILNAEDKIHLLEYELFQHVVADVVGHTVAIQATAVHIAQLDVLVSFALCSAQYNYVRPGVDGSQEIHLLGCRHPVVERLEDNFVPNDISIKKNETLVITGPNMSGKSVSMKQVALIVLMAQIGCFVPAASAVIGVVDRIFTRVGASDDLSTGQSTFMVEMNETANILNNATEGSLIILDEIGRGTSTYDGVSIAWSVADYIVNNIKAKTLFATHYHILNKLADQVENVSNYTVAVKEDGENVVFLHKILKGSTNKSYGVHVARLAGLPTAVIEKAVEIQKKLEGEDKIMGKIDG